MTTGRRLGAVLVGMALVAMPAVALAQGTSSADTLALDHLAPGLSRSAAVSVTNESTGPATVALATFDLADDDHGCARPEAQAGDTTCGAGGGELRRWLDMTVSDHGRQLWTGAFTELQEDQRLPVTLDPGETRDLEISVGLPFEAGNDTMTDQVGFDLRIRTLGVTGEDAGPPEVLGVQASAGPHDGHPISVPTIIEAGLTSPATAAAGVLTDNRPEAVFAVLLLLAVGLTVRAVRRSRRGPEGRSGVS